MMPASHDPTQRRHGGNACSTAAFENGRPRHEGDRERLLAMIAAAPTGMTSKEIGARLGRPLNAFSGRLTELKASGLIEGTGVSRDHAEVLRRRVVVPMQPEQLSIFAGMLTPAEPRPTGYER